jgi:hypothetical protein
MNNRLQTPENVPGLVVLQLHSQFPILGQLFQCLQLTMLPPVVIGMLQQTIIVVWLIEMVLMMSQLTRDDGWARIFSVL